MSDTGGLSRRGVLAAAAGVLAGAAGGAAAPVGAGQRAWDFAFTSIEDGTLNLSDYRGQVLLVTNTASFCGFTYEFEGLQALYDTQKPKGLVVVGVPSQDFNQEADSNARVKQFCDATFGVEFPMAGISHVVGPQAAPFYAWVRQQRSWQPDWNFNKVLVGRDGAIRATYGAEEEPGGPTLTAAIQAELAKGA